MKHHWSNLSQEQKNKQYSNVAFLYLIGILVAFVLGMIANSDFTTAVLTFFQEVK